MLRVRLTRLSVGPLGRSFKGIAPSPRFRPSWRTFICDGSTCDDFGFMLPAYKTSDGERLVMIASIISPAATAAIFGALILWCAYAIVREGFRDAKWQREQERRIREREFANVMAEWLLALRPKSGESGGFACMHGVVGVTSSEPILRVITSENLARCGVDGLTIARFAARYGDSVLNSTDTTLTLRVTEKLLHKWAFAGLTLDCMANLLLDKAARSSFEADGTRIATIRIDQSTRVRKAEERALQALRQREVVKRDEARRTYEAMRMYHVVKTVEEAAENAGRPYGEAQKLSEDVLDRVYVLLRNEQDAALIAALWKAVAAVQTTTRASSAELQP